MAGMRIAALVALVLALSACSQSTTGRPQAAEDHPPAKTTTAAPSPTAPSREGQLNERIAWVRAGSAADVGQYRSVTTEGRPATALNGDIAFTSPSGKISCITGTEYGIDGLNCVVKLKSPIPKPGEGFGNWDGGYVNYTGTKLTVGQFRGDPGLFINGNGQTLPYDSTLTFDDYTCRIATSGLTCVNPTDRSGVQMSDDGIVALGCLREVPAAQRESSVGQAFGC
ncbi:hypothetical protein [Nocardia brasiliensis]|uniref:hypothetical protein n=1 Tax=Nocardia brasiliensis TaxID=37326 RepID=UPI0024555714|nr:hypothetical protein [Nocardia brasiliensis]